MAEATGETWLDDVDLNGNILIVSDQAMGQLQIRVEMAGAWL